MNQSLFLIEEDPEDSFSTHPSFAIPHHNFPVWLLGREPPEKWVFLKHADFLVNKISHFIIRYSDKETVNQYLQEVQKYHGDVQGVCSKTEVLSTDCSLASPGGILESTDIHTHTRYWI